MFAKSNLIWKFKELIKRKKAAKKTFAILIDPDRQDNSQLIQTIKCANQAKVDYFFVGGSLLIDDNLERCIQSIKQNSSIPVILGKIKIMINGEKEIEVDGGSTLLTTLSNEGIFLPSS